MPINEIIDLGGSWGTDLSGLDCATVFPTLRQGG